MEGGNDTVVHGSSRPIGALVAAPVTVVAVLSALVAVTLWCLLRRGRRRGRGRGRGVVQMRKAPIMPPAGEGGRGTRQTRVELTCEGTSNLIVEACEAKTSCTNKTYESYYYSCDLEDELYEDVIHQDELYEDVIHQDELYEDVIHQDELYEDVIHQDELYEDVIHQDELYEDVIHQDELYEDVIHQDELYEDVIHQDELYEDVIHQDELYEDVIHQDELYEDVIHQDELYEDVIHQDELYEDVIHQDELYEDVIHQDELYEDVIHQDEWEREAYIDPPSDTSALVRQVWSMNQRPRTVDSSNLQLGRVIGRGQFASVHLAVLSLRDGTSRDVAVKVLQRNTDKKYQLSFFRECLVMSQFNHPNIISFIGVAAGSDTRLMVLELMGKGALRGVLKELTQRPTLHKRLDIQLLQFAADIVSGMVYLSRKGFIHRDLSTSNIMVSNDNLCKIGDFGLTASMPSKDTNGRVPVPLRWAPPEVIENNEYSTMSDIWSYGVVLYEIWSLGKIPYGDLSNQEIVEFVFSGKRLSPPPGCPKPMYNIMVTCWHPRSSSRPTFPIVQSILNKPKGTLLAFLPDNPSELPPEGCTLGETLHSSLTLYKNLQSSYLIPNTYTMQRS